MEQAMMMKILTTMRMRESLTIEKTWRNLEATQIETLYVTKPGRSERRSRQP
jgi:hypothetical protein